MNLTAKIELLRARVEALERELAQLKDSFPDEEIIVLRSIPREEAKQEILAQFQSGETLYYSEIARRLQLELPVVVELCQELQDEGEIEVDADAV
jgi:O6-methylguanine-DNA--protein-cysteine methyltransferase